MRAKPRVNLNYNYIIGKGIFIMRRSDRNYLLVEENSEKCVYEILNIFRNQDFYQYLYVTPNIKIRIMFRESITVPKCRQLYPVMLCIKTSV